MIASFAPSLATRVVTERLVLRPPRASDVAELRRAIRENAAHLRPWEPAPVSNEDPSSLTAIANRITRARRDWRRDAGYGFLVTRGGGAEGGGGGVVGRVNLAGIFRGAFHNAYMGYWIDVRVQGQGYMTEAVRGAFAFAFGAARLHRVQVAIMPRNAPSLRIMEKLGVRREGFAERYLKIAGAWEDHVIFAITAEEWEAQAQGR